jgi:hypothetical protein
MSDKLPVKNIPVATWLTVEEWKEFKSVCDRLVEKGFLPENPSRYVMVKYAILEFTKNVGKLLDEGKIKSLKE